MAKKSEVNRLLMAKKSEVNRLSFTATIDVKYFRVPFTPKRGNKVNKV